MSSEEEEDEAMGDAESDEYPPWLQIVLDEDANYWDEVVILQEAAGGVKYKEWVEVKHILAPDTTEAATQALAGKRGQCRTYHVKRFSTILIASEPTSAPYIGLVAKVFLQRGAKKVREVNGKPVYKLSDFGVQAYWFYRPSEVPEGAWRKHRKLEQHTEGSALFRLPDSKKQQKEKHSERQVLFSSHHTLHDYPDTNGILALDGFLQACKIHWLGSNTPELPRYEIHDNALIAVQEPGFVVRGFLWCAPKDEPQLDGRYKEVHKLESCKWPDKETVGIVQSCMREYQEKTRKALLARNKAVVTRLHAAQAAKQQNISSDDDDADADPTTGSVGGAVGPGRPSSTAKSPAGKAGAASAAARAGPVAVSSPRLDGVDDLNELEDDDDDLGIMYDPALDESD